MHKSLFRAASLICPLIAFAASSCAENDGVVRASGTIEVSRVIVSAKTGGEIRTLQVDEGARVKKGDVLARIDDTALSLQCEQARALLIKAQNEERVAAEDLRIMLALYAGGSATRKQRDDAEARGKAARAAVDAARIGVELIEKQMRDAVVLSPLDGLITQKLVEQGELVFPGSALFAVSDLSRAHITIYLTARDLARISVGRKAEIEVDAFGKRRWTGTIVYISPEAEFTPKNVQSKEDRAALVFAVKIDIPNPDEALKPGMQADVSVNAAEETSR